MSALAEQLLSEFAVEEITNPDVGAYEDAIFTGGEARVTKKGGYMMVAQFEAPRKSGVGTIRHKEYVNLAKEDSHPRVKQMAVGWYRAFGVVPSGTKNIPICKDFNDAERLVAAINGDTAGKVVGISLHEDDAGKVQVWGIEGWP
jgi:hypothetical protein